MNKTIITINEKDYELIYNINTMCAMAQEGIDILNLSDQKIDLIFIRALFYHGLREQNKKITLNKAGELMTEYLQEGNNFNNLMVLVMGAIAKSLGNDINKDEVVEADYEEIEEGK